MRNSAKSLWKRLALTGCAFALVLAGSTWRASADDLTEKLQATIANLSAQQQAALYLLLSELKADGDAGSETAGPISAEAAFKNILGTITTSLSDVENMETEEALDLLMGVISEDFEYYQVGGKSDLRDFLEGAFDMGYIEMYGPDTEILTEDTEVTVDGETATIYPVEVEGPWGSATLEFEARLEGDTWRIIGLDISGV